jgi:hypothetical protein
MIATSYVLLLIGLTLANYRDFGRDAALRRPVGAARRPYHGSAFRQFYANVCDARWS